MPIPCPMEVQGRLPSVPWEGLQMAGLMGFQGGHLRRESQSCQLPPLLYIHNNFGNKQCKEVIHLAFSPITALSCCQGWHRTGITCPWGGEKASLWYPSEKTPIPCHLLQPPVPVGCLGRAGNLLIPPGMESHPGG